MNYEELKALNDRLKAEPIKGKPYVMVNDRVQGFRELYPEGCIVTELVNYIPDDYAVVVAKAYADNDASKIPLATGMAQETVAKNKNINRTSMLENCETSAVGRCLGFLGIGSVDSIASADEINKANNKAAELDGYDVDAETERLKAKKISDSHVKSIITMADKIGIGIPVILREYGVGDLAEMTEAQYGECMGKLAFEARKKEERVIGAE